MISLVPVEGVDGTRRFSGVAREVLRPHPNHRSTEDDVAAMLLERRSVYFQHAELKPFVLTEGGRDVGHVAFIHDRNLPDFVQAAFFGALPGLEGVSEVVVAGARAAFPGVRRLVVGLNGHLNYSAGILASRFEEPPLFGLNWTPPHYPGYFTALRPRSLVSYRFDAAPFYEYAERRAAGFDPGRVRVRTMDRRRLKAEIGLYTALNNACFGQHPYWSNRTPEEDFELFHPFRFLLKEENLLFAEVDGQAIGFLLWYPDFQQLVSKADETLGLTHVLRYHLWNPIQAVRFTEIGVRPEHRLSRAIPALVLEMIRRVRRGGYSTCEGGFIFEDNRASLGMTLGLIERAVGKKLEPHRRFHVYEGEL